MRVTARGMLKGNDAEVSRECHSFACWLCC